MALSLILPNPFTPLTSWQMKLHYRRASQLMLTNPHTALGKSPYRSELNAHHCLSVMGSSGRKITELASRRSSENSSYSIS